MHIFCREKEDVIVSICLKREMNITKGGLMCSNFYDGMNSGWGKGMLADAREKEREKERQQRFDQATKLLQRLGSCVTVTPGDVKAFVGQLTELLPENSLRMLKNEFNNRIK
jgi:hypothetical protein